MSEEPKNVGIDLTELGISGKSSVINMWTGEKLGEFTENFSQDLNEHASGLYSIKAN